MKFDIWKKSIDNIEKEMALKYFKLSEFESPDLPGVNNMCPKFLKKLDKARELSGCSYVISSGFRSEETNKRVGGVPNSSHLKGCAADIVCKDSGTRQKIVNGLIQAGFTRIGIADTFIHCDTDKDKNNAIWLY